MPNWSILGPFYHLHTPIFQRAKTCRSDLWAQIPPEASSLILMLGKTFVVLWTQRVRTLRAWNCERKFLHTCSISSTSVESHLWEKKAHESDHTGVTFAPAFWPFQRHKLWKMKDLRGNNVAKNRRMGKKPISQHFTYVSRFFFFQKTRSFFEVGVNFVAR